MPTKNIQMKKTTSAVAVFLAVIMLGLSSARADQLFVNVAIASRPQVPVIGSCKCVADILGQGSLTIIDYPGGGKMTTLPGYTYDGTDMKATYIGDLPAAGDTPITVHCDFRGQVEVVVRGKKVRQGRTGSGDTQNIKIPFTVHYAWPTPAKVNIRAN